MSSTNRRGPYFTRLGMPRTVATREQFTSFLVAHGRKFGVLCFMATVWLGVGHCAAADADPLQPIPEQPGAMAQTPATGQPQASPFRDETSACANGDCEDFCGMPLCSPPGRYWLRADYLMWWTSGTQLPPLVTNGALSPTTTIFYGNETIANDVRSGVRTTIGMWLDPCHVWNLEFDYLTLGERANNFSMGSNGSQAIYRPFFDVQTNAQSQEAVSVSGVVAGTVSVDAKEYFQSAGVLVSYHLCGGDMCGGACDSCGDACGSTCADACDVPKLYCCRTDLLAGFRYYGLSDSIGIHEDLTQLTAPNALIDVRDNFSARNEFFGSEIGLRNQIYRGRWSLEILTKIAIGNTHQTVDINGQTTVTVPGQGTNVYDAGVLAVGSNSGTYHRDVFTVIPQLGLELGYQVNCHWRAYAGYNLMYWGSVLRSAEQIDLNVDPRNFPPTDPQNPGLPFPAFPGRASSFWAHGVNLGTEFRF